MCFLALAEFDENRITGKLLFLLEVLSRIATVQPSGQQQQQKYLIKHNFINTAIAHSVESTDQIYYALQQ